MRNFFLRHLLTIPANAASSFGVGLAAREYLKHKYYKNYSNGYTQGESARSQEQSCPNIADYINYNGYKMPYATVIEIGVIGFLSLTAACELIYNGVKTGRGKYLVFASAILAAAMVTIGTLISQSAQSLKDMSINSGKFDGFCFDDCISDVERICDNPCYYITDSCQNLSNWPEDYNKDTMGYLIVLGGIIMPILSLGLSAISEAIQPSHNNPANNPEELQRINATSQITYTSV